MGTFGDSWTLTKTAFRMIREERALLWIPALAGLCLLGVLALAVVPLLAFVALAPGAAKAAFGSTATVVAFIALWIGVYFALVFVGTYFTAALIGAATLKL